MRVHSFCRPVGLLSALLLAAGGVGVAAAEDAAVDAAIRMQDAFVKVAEHAFPSVVVITNKRIERRPLYPQLPPEFRFFFGVPEGDGAAPEGRGGAPPVPAPVGKGSGIIIRPDGYILTNFHVIRDHDALEIQLNDGRVFDSGRDKNAVQIVGVDEETDLAVIRIGDGAIDGLPTLVFAESDAVRVGEWAIAVGAPFNLDYSVTVGVVSQKGRHGVGMSTFERYIQTDASINPGNSGGPLLNIRGEVIGISNFIVTGGGMSRGSIGLGFAIDSELARQVADDLIAHGSVVRPFLGIAMQPLTEELKAQFGVDTGVLVSDAMPGDPAAQAGVEAGDVILKVGEHPVRTPNDVLFAVLKYRPGDRILLFVDRRGEKKEFEVVARQRDQRGDGPDGIAGRGDPLRHLGLALEEGERGVLVAGVGNGSRAEAARIRRGDLIIEVNRQAVKTVADVIAVLRESNNDMAVFYIERRGAKLFVPVNIGK